MSLFGITHVALLIHFYMRVLIEFKSMQPGILSIDLPMTHQEYDRITIECYNRTPANILNSFKKVVSILQRITVMVLIKKEALSKLQKEKYLVT